MYLMWSCIIGAWGRASRGGVISTSPLSSILDKIHVFLPAVDATTSGQHRPDEHLKSQALKLSLRLAKKTHDTLDIAAQEPSRNSHQGENRTSRIDLDISTHPENN